MHVALFLFKMREKACISKTHQNAVELTGTGISKSPLSARRVVSVTREIRCRGACGLVSEVARANSHSANCCIDVSAIPKREHRR